jgi:hypothetical protein
MIAPCIVLSLKIFQWDKVEVGDIDVNDPDPVVGLD